MKLPWRFVIYTLIGMIMLTTFCGIFVLGEGELDEHCDHVTDCRPGAGYYCAGNRTCQCWRNYVPNEERSKCVGGVGQKCEYDDDCVPGAFCKGQEICRCKKTHPIVADDSLACLSNGSESAFEKTT